MNEKEFSLDDILSAYKDIMEKSHISFSIADDLQFIIEGFEEEVEKEKKIKEGYLIEDPTGLEYSRFRYDCAHPDLDDLLDCVEELKEIKEKGYDVILNRHRESLRDKERFTVSEVKKFEIPNEWVKVLYNDEEESMLLTGKWPNLESLKGYFFVSSYFEGDDVSLPKCRTMEGSIFVHGTIDAPVCQSMEEVKIYKNGVFKASDCQEIKGSVYIKDDGILDIPNCKIIYGKVKVGEKGIFHVPECHTFKKSVSVLGGGVFSAPKCKTIEGDVDFRLHSVFDVSDSVSINGKFVHPEKKLSSLAKDLAKQINEGDGRSERLDMAYYLYSLGLRPEDVEDFRKQVSSFVREDSDYKGIPVDIYDEDLKDEIDWFVPDWVCELGEFEFNRIGVDLSCDDVACLSPKVFACYFKEDDNSGYHQLFEKDASPIHTGDIMDFLFKKESGNTITKSGIFVFDNTEVYAFTREINDSFGILKVDLKTGRKEQHIFSPASDINIEYIQNSGLCAEVLRSAFDHLSELPFDDVNDSLRAGMAEWDIMPSNSIKI